MTPTLKEEAEEVMCYFMTVRVKIGILPHNNVIHINCSNAWAVTNIYYTIT